MFFLFFFFNDTATTEIYTLSLHDALPICVGGADEKRRDGEAQFVENARRQKVRQHPPTALEIGRAHV